MERLRNKRVLIVDDDPETRELIRINLHGALFTADFARHGHEALRMYEQAKSEGIPYDLLMLDVSMPEMSGFKVLEDIRKGGDFCTHAVLCTGYSPEPVMNFRASAAKADDIWYKPESIVNAKQLIEGQLLLQCGSLTHPAVPGNKE
jgi:CheY-like chemotaxis protein